MLCATISGVVVHSKSNDDPSLLQQRHAHPTFVRVDASESTSSGSSDVFNKGCTRSSSVRQDMDDDDYKSDVTSSSNTTTTTTTTGQSIGQQTYEIPQQFNRVQYGRISRDGNNDDDYYYKNHNEKNTNKCSTRTSSRVTASTCATNTNSTGVSVVRYGINNNNNNHSSTSVGANSCSSYCTTSTSSDDMILQCGTLEPILVSSLLPDDSYIVDHVSFDLQSCHTDDNDDDNDERGIIHNNNHHEQQTLNNRSIEKHFTLNNPTRLTSYNDCTASIVVRTTSDDDQHQVMMSSSCDTIALSSACDASVVDEKEYQSLTTDTILPCPEATYIEGEQNHVVVNSSNLEQQQQQQQEQSQIQPTDYAMGDHVYQWCSLAGIPRVYQHHGIVLDVFYCHIEKEWVLKIVDFSSWDLQQEEEEQLLHLQHDPNLVNTSSTVPDDFSVMTEGTAVTTTSTTTLNRRYKGKTVRKKSFIRSNCPAGGCIRIYESAANNKDSGNIWHKVTYKAGFWKQQTGRSGTCTASDCDPPGLVRARAQFLIDHPYLLPPYSAVRSNCECVAVWCKTGTWCTLQASSWLWTTVASQAKQAATIAGVATAATVTVPASGMWGWFGYTTTVSLISTQPLLLPAIATYGVITTVGPALWLLRAKHHWKALTERLNTSFWDDAVNHPDVFVDCITHWATMNYCPGPAIDGNNNTMTTTNNNTTTTCAASLNSIMVDAHHSISSSLPLAVSSSGDGCASPSPMKDS